MKLGVDLGGTKIEGVLLDDAGAIAARRRVPTPAGDYEATVRAVAQLVAELEAERGAATSIGIGTPGALRPRAQTLKNSNSTCLNDRPLKRDLEAALGRPIALANDADCFALSEATDGAGQGRASVFGVILGTGVGGGWVLHGRLAAGPNAIAGEWGHTPLPWPADDERPGPACYCGRHGCVETWVSGPALAADHVRHGGAAIDVAAIGAAAADGDPDAIDTLQRWDGRLARGLAVVIDIVDPDIVVLGGGLSNLPSLTDRLPGLVSRWVFSDELRTEFAVAKYGDSSGVRGAAWLGAAG